MLIQFQFQFIALLLIVNTPGKTEVVKILIENGANVNARDYENVTPLHSSAIAGHIFRCEFFFYFFLNLQ